MSLSATPKIQEFLFDLTSSPAERVLVASKLSNLKSEAGKKVLEGLLDNLKTVMNVELVKFLVDLTIICSRMSVFIFNWLKFLEIG